MAFAGTMANGRTWQVLVDMHAKMHELIEWQLVEGLSNTDIADMFNEIVTKRTGYAAGNTANLAVQFTSLHTETRKCRNK